MMLKRIFSYVMLFIMALLLVSWTITDNRQYPPEVEYVLVKSGENRHELEKMLRYFQEKGDEQMLQAAFFLVRNRASSRYISLTLKIEKSGRHAERTWVLCRC